MKNLTSLLCLLLLGLGVSCTRLDPSIPGCIRFTELSSTHYRMEAGTFGPDGFIPSHSATYAYAQNLHRRSDLVPVLGKPLLPLATWKVIDHPRGIRRSEDTSTIAGVPFIALEHMPRI